MAHWRSLLADESIVAQTVLVDGRVVGNVVSFDEGEGREVGYWIGREFWGRGVATEALRAFLTEDTTRPMFGRCAADNIASLRVLEKCGFRRIGTERGFANARGEEIEELVLELA